MKQLIFILSLSIIKILGCFAQSNKERIMELNAKRDIAFNSGYAEVNGLQMYYEIYGHGEPLVLIHGGGSTIQTNFEKIIPLLAKSRQLIAVELQAHGRTNDRDADISFEQDADDIAALLKKLNIEKSDFLGFSNGGTTALQIAIRHPKIVNKLILCSALAKRNGVPDGFWSFMEQAKLENMPELLKEGYQKVAADPQGLQVMHDRDAKRMLNFKDIPDEQIQSVQAPTLIIIGDKDVITPEHALELHRQIKGSKLAIIPGGHGEYIGEVTTIKSEFKESDLAIPIIEKFLDKKQSIPNDEQVSRHPFIISHIFQAEIKTVYEMWLDPQHFSQWLGPTGAKMTFLKASVKEGETSTWSMTTLDGMTKYGQIHYQTIAPNSSLIYIQNFCDKDGNFIKAPFSATYPNYLLTTVNFEEEEPGKTKVTVTWEIFSEASLDEQKTFNEMQPLMSVGWKASFEKLEVLLASK